MVMLYAISRSEIAYKLSAFCVLKDNSRDGMRTIACCCRHDCWL